MCCIPIVIWDDDSSGTHFAYDVEAAKPGAAPPGVPTGPNVGPQRMASLVAWAAAHGFLVVLGETGWGNDDPTSANPEALDNAAGWNTAARNMIAYCQTNKIPVFIWGAGPGFPLSYSYNPEASDLMGGKNFASTGFQSPQLVVIEEFTGYTGPQPTNYRIEFPFQNGQTVLYGMPGQVMPGTFPFRIKYNGILSSAVTFTPFVTLADGSTPAGGTFNPATVTLSPGTNPKATFTFTPSTAQTMLLGATNSAGWTNPPLQSLSSINDQYYQLGTVLSPILSVRREYTPYVGPAFRLLRDSDNAEKDFYFNNKGDLPRQAIQDWASSRTPKITVQYDGSGWGNDATHSGGRGYPVLTLDNGSGYPEVTFPSGAQAGMEFRFPVQYATQVTIMAKAYPYGYGQFVRQDYPNGPFNFTLQSFNVHDGSSSFDATAQYSGPSNSYHNFTGTFKVNDANGVAIYLDGAQQNTASTLGVTSLNTQGDYGNDVTVQYGWFKYYGGGHFEGGVQSLRLSDNIALTAAQQQSFITADAGYYSTPLPDTLGPVAPTISGTGNMPAALTAKANYVLSGVNITDSNPGNQTLSVVLSAIGGTLSTTSIAADTPSNVSNTLHGITFTPSGAAGSSASIQLTVTNPTTNKTATATVTITVTAAAPAETPFAVPTATFTPVNLGGYYKGVNLAGGEQNFFSTNPYGYDYVYPRPVEIAQAAALGYNTIRMPINNRRVQPYSYGALDAPTYSNPSDGHTGEMKKALDAALAHGMWVIIDQHDYALIYDTLSGVLRRVGQDPEGTAQAIDLAVRLKTKFKNYPNVIWGYNEPHDLSATDWASAYKQMISAMAAISTNQPILVPGIEYTKARTWVSNGSAAAWTGYVPPAGQQIMFEVHQYMDGDEAGDSEDVDQGAGNYKLQACTQWARQQGVKMFLGEFAWSYNDTNTGGSGTPSVEGKALLDYMSANNDVWAGWTYWNFGSSLFYSNQPLSCVPHGYDNGPFTQAAQTAILTSHLGVGTAPPPAVHATHMRTDDTSSDTGSVIYAPTTGLKCRLGERCH